MTTRNGGRVRAWDLYRYRAWCVLNLLVSYGPLLLLTLGTTFHQISQKGFRNLPWADIGKLLGTAQALSLAS